MGKTIVIGIDSLMPNFVEKITEEGYMPNVAKLMKKGSYSRVIPVPPSLTPTNWSTIATGAEPRTHEVSCFFVHEHGSAPYDFKSAFRSEVCKAEKIWQTVEKAGKTPITIEFPASYPVEFRNGIHIGEYGSPSRAEKEVTFSKCFTTLDLQYADKVELEPVEGWENIPVKVNKGLEFKMKIIPTAWEIGWPFTHPETIPNSRAFEYDALVYSSKSNGYDTIAVCKDKDFSKCVVELQKGNYSDFIVEEFFVAGKIVKAAFRMKLIELSPDARRLRLYLSEVYPVDDFTFPSNLSKELFEHCGPYQPLIFQDLPVMKGWIDLETYKEETEYNLNWLAKCASYLIKSKKWDLMMMKWHSPDHVKHSFWHLIDPVCHGYDPTRLGEGWDIFRWNYQLVDKLVGEIMKSVDDNVSIVIISDHGHIPHVYSLMMNDVLAKDGLLVWDSDGNIDWSKTKAYAQRLMYIYVNLEGREPTGIVKPSEYEEVRKKIIDTLLGLKDPRTGIHPINVALTVENAEALGVGGPTVGDVFYATEPGWGSLDNREKFGEIFPSPEEEPPAVWGHSHHGQNIGDARISLGGIYATFIAAGPNIKRGYRRESPFRMTDVAPTIAQMLGVPAPRNSEGSMVRDVFEG